MTATPSDRTDVDLDDQARAGHGIPSQDTNPSAQFALSPDMAVREAESVFIGGGVVAGAATGAAAGVLFGGPVGVVAGAALGAVAGALGGAAAGAASNTTPTDSPPPATVRLHIDDSGGAGRPVILIHGWPLNAEAWTPQVTALRAAGHRVIAYDRRGFGRSDKPLTGYDYDTLADDLRRVLEQCELQEATLVGFSMGGGEVARYLSRFGSARLHSVVFAASVTPCLMRSADNPEGPLTPDVARHKRQALEEDRDDYFATFTQAFFSANGELQVSPAQRAEAIAQCQQSAPHAALACMDAFSTTDFRADLAAATLPTLVIHGTADAIVPFEASGLRTHRAIPHSRLVKIDNAPHGLNLSHTAHFNDALLSFLHAPSKRAASH